MRIFFPPIFSKIIFVFKLVRLRHQINSIRFYNKKNTKGANPFKDFVGVAPTHPYEKPTHPDLRIDTTRLSVEESVAVLLRFLEHINLSFPFDSRPELACAVEAALKAGKVVLDAYLTDFNVLNEDKKFPVTKADKASHAVILSFLTDYPVVSEEGDIRVSDKKTVWIVDPLDGTSDFVSRTGEFTIMIALVEHHVPVVGVIYWPVKDELYVAQKGKGAYVYAHGTWSRLLVSSISNLHKTRLLASRHHLSEEEKKFIGTLGLPFDSRGSSLKAMNIARGKADLYFTFAPLREWDTCASTCILTEAGGKITDMLGKPLAYLTPEMRHKNGVLMSNGKLHDALVQMYKQFKSIDS